MTAATYTFTLSAAQSSSATMNVAMRAKTGSSIPGNASRWQGGTMPTATLTWAAGATTATTTVNTAPNSAVDGNAEYEWYKVSSTPSDLTLDTSALPTVTITDDDSSGGGGLVVYNQTAADSGYQDLGANGGTLEMTLYDTAYEMTLLSAATGQPSYRLRSALSNGRISGFVIASDGSSMDDNQVTFTDIGSLTNGVAVKVVIGNSITFYAGDMNTPKFTVGSAGRGTGTYVRHQTGGAAVPIKITKN